MKLHSLVNSLVLGVMVGAGSLEISKGIINTFSYDIFRKCVTGEYEFTSPICQYGPQISINLFAAVIFFFTTWLVMGKLTNMLTSKLGIAVLSVIFFLLLSAFWRILLSLQDNFLISEGPSRLSEYLYVGFAWLDTVIVGLIVGFAAWLPKSVNRTALERSEPRIKFVKK
jgi:hypothetical protein